MQPAIKDYFGKDSDVDKPIHEHNDKEFYSSLPHRPEGESELDSFKIYCNAFKVDFPKTAVVNYEARFSPDSENSGLKRALLVAHFRKLNLKVITDGSHVSLPRALGESEKLIEITARNSNTYKIELVQAEGNYFDIQKGNILLKGIIIDGNKKMVSWRKSFFDFSNARSFSSNGEDLKVLQGFSSTIQLFNDESYVVIDKSFRVFRGQTYLDTIKNKNQVEVLKDFQPTTLFNTITKRLEKIDAINYEMNPASTFDRKGKGQISFAEYYKERYNREVRDMDQPLLVQKKIEKDSEGKEVEKPPAYYIPELMLPTGMTDNMRADRRLMTDLAGMFHADARTKMNELQKTVTDHISNLEDLKEWNIKVDSNPAEFDANRVKNPELRFADGKTLQPQRNRDWNRDLRGYSFLNMKELNDWTAIVPHSCRDDFDKFERELSKYYNRIRVGYKPPRIENWGNSINEIQDSIKNSTLVFAVAATDSIYEQVKKFSVDHHVPTQCIKTQTLRRPTLTPIISMITLQMQGKIGGIPWCIDLDKNFDDAMTVGIDVISSGKEREILAVVNSVDKEMTVYKKSSVVEKKGLHLAGIHIGEYIEDSLESYKDKNGSYPKKVIIYRGSANSGDLKNLKSGELEQIKQKLNDIDSSIQFIYIAVNNKHDMKFFIKEGSNYEGPNPGTVIFNGLTKSDLFQFYLVSHVPKKGLVRPSLYFVLDNTLDVKQDAIYNLTYQLSHLYFNGTNSVCFPSPLYQANKFCKMLNDCGIVEGARRKPQMSGGFGGPRGNRGNMRGRGGDRRGDDRRDDRRDYRRDDRRDDRRDYHRDDRRDDYRRDERRDYRRDDRRDDYRRDERRDDYRRDDYRRDERRDDYRRDERRDDYRRDERRDYRRDDRRDDYRRDERRDYH